MIATQNRPITTPPLKWHGGKHYLARRIVKLMPAHEHYVEPFAGGLSVLLAKEPEGVSEVVNDLDGTLTNFWRVLQSPEQFEMFQRHVEAVPFSQIEWDDSSVDSGADAPWERAVSFFIRCRMSLAGRMDSFAPLSRTRLRRGMNEQASAWLGTVDGLPAVHSRLKRVVILNRPAVNVIRQQDGPQTLFYLDPPYLHSTRASPDTYGKFEMSRDGHDELLDVIGRVNGRAMLSGYRSDLYDQTLSHWRRVDFERPVDAAGGEEKRRVTECVWCNFHQ